MPGGKQIGWKVLAGASGALAGLTTQRLLGWLWRSVRSASPPPAADRRSSWPDALSWAVATGVGVGVARLLAIRTAAVVWEATVHEVPPDPALDVGKGS